MIDPSTVKIAIVSAMLGFIANCSNKCLDNDVQVNQKSEYKISTTAQEAMESKIVEDLHYDLGYSFKTCQIAESSHLESIVPLQEGSSILNFAANAKCYNDHMQCVVPLKLSYMIDSDRLVMDMNWVFAGDFLCNSDD